jgi:hypothetical protein
MVEGLSSYTVTSTNILRLVLILLQVLMLLKNKGEQGSVPVMRAIPWIERVISAEGKDAIAVLDKMPGHTAEGGRWFKVRRTCTYIHKALAWSRAPVLLLLVRPRCPALTLSVQPFRGCCLQSHSPWQFVPKGEGVKYIVAMRNPKDTMVSMYHHAKSKVRLSTTTTEPPLMLRPRPLALP